MPANRIDVSNLSIGHYLLEMQLTDGQTFIGKFVKV